MNPSKPFEFNICKNLSRKQVIKCEIDNSPLYSTCFHDTNKHQESFSSRSIENFSVNIISNQVSIGRVEETNQEEPRFIFLKDMGSEM